MYFKMMKRLNLLAGCQVVLCVLLSSCATASFSKYKGVGRVKRYDFYSAQLPDSFDGFRVALLQIFITRVGLPPVVCQACARHFVRWMRMCCYWEVTIGGVTEEM